MDPWGVIACVGRQRRDGKTARHVSPIEINLLKHLMCKCFIFTCIAPQEGHLTQISKPKVSRVLASKVNIS